MFLKFSALMIAVFVLSRSKYISLTLILQGLLLKLVVFVSDYVYFETSSTSPYQIRRIEELNKVSSFHIKIVVCV